MTPNPPQTPVSILMTIPIKSRKRTIYLFLNHCVNWIISVPPLCPCSSLSNKANSAVIWTPHTIADNRQEKTINLIALHIIYYYLQRWHINWLNSTWVTPILRFLNNCTHWADRQGRVNRPEVVIVTGRPSIAELQNERNFDDDGRLGTEWWLAGYHQVPESDNRGQLSQFKFNKLRNY